LRQIGPRVTSAAVTAILLFGSSSMRLKAEGSPAARRPALTHLTAVWANTGEDKVTRDELRATANPTAVKNSVWDGTKVKLFGARNEVVAFNLVLEAAKEDATGVSVLFDSVASTDDSIRSKPTSGNGVFRWTERPIELFYVRYLQIRGLSHMAYENYYDERHVPIRMRRPWTGRGQAVPGTGWKDRPDHDAYYPDIAVPLEIVKTFDIDAGENQSIWVDVYIPKSARPGLYNGTVQIREQSDTTWTVPVRLEVCDFTLPDEPNAKTMLFYEYADINKRHLGTSWPAPRTKEAAASRRIIDRHFLVAHRHKVSLIDGNDGPGEWNRDAPRPEWKPRLDGSLFSAKRGYDGPGAGTPNSVFSIGTYGDWSWQDQGEQAMRTHTDRWVSWFVKNAPRVEYFLYLIDEPHTPELYAEVEKWSKWINDNPGPGGKLMSLATVSMPEAVESMPSLDITCSAAQFGITKEWEAAIKAYRAEGRRAYLYAGLRPAAGTMATEDDGVAPRQIAWTQYKKKIDRWFIWDATYYNNFQCDRDLETNVFQNAQTFGCDERYDEVEGRTGWSYSNGDGVLFYPGTEKLYHAESYRVEGPFASLRLKYWRRGIQDVDYLALAAAVDAAAVDRIVKRMIPKVLWEVGVDNTSDPTYVHSDISWSVDPDVWEAARRELAGIISEELRRPDP